VGEGPKRWRFGWCSTPKSRPRSSKKDHALRGYYWRCHLRSMPKGYRLRISLASVRPASFGGHRRQPKDQDAKDLAPEGPWKAGRLELRQETKPEADEGQGKAKGPRAHCGAMGECLAVIHDSCKITRVPMEYSKNLVVER